VVQGVRRERKELRAQMVVRAWWGDALHPWKSEVTGEDGEWLKVSGLAFLCVSVCVCACVRVRFCVCVSE